MPFQSPYPPLVFPQTSIIEYIFDGAVSDQPLWIDSHQPQRNISTRQALQWAKRIGCGLERLGMQKGDVVLICSPNHILMPPAFLGIAGAGFIFTGVNPSYTAEEVTHQLSDSTAKVVLVHPSVVDTVVEAATRVGLARDRIFLFSGQPAPEPEHAGIRDWTAMTASAEEADSWPWTHPQPQAIAAINYSSGTTGLPKGVCISHANLVANVEQFMFMMTDVVADSQQQRWICFLPLFHAYAQIFGIFSASKLGVPVFVLPRYDVEHVLDLIQRHRITTMHIVPPALVTLAKRPIDSYDLSSLKVIFCGAAPLLRQVQKACEARLKVQIRQGWGLTEMTAGCTKVPLSDHDTAGLVGKLMPGCEAKLVDDHGREVGVGQSGEMYIRGPNMCQGYWRNERATRELIDGEGWLRTGDVAICDADGWFSIVDRKKELIKVNAFQVAPAELEAVLLENEQVADAAVVGFSVDEGNERPRAYVVPQPAWRHKLTPQDISSWVASRVAKYKRLDGGVVFVDEIPKLPSGKIKRKLVKERAALDAAKLKAEERRGPRAHL
ncbi:4-coumarate-CoA ligase 2 [Ophiocordyceps camponoti-floridani]|uniref:4-coumarate-CoA ligase 2 n=1 Tax=Ophiocordyceps camponoti-floridani TaxID=2030778 RepID=A0A8H4QBF2_9HYPO|nr:4-coumarate-CoA ligase 2 [Ophiocordyceps camponoti-floridani]